MNATPSRIAQRLFRLLGICLALATVAPATAGTLRATAGTVTINGSVTVSNMIIESGAIWRGTGSVIGDVEVSGTASPGPVPLSAIGTQTVSGAVLFKAGSSFEIYASTHTELDRLNAAGTVSGTCTVVLTTAPTAVPLWQTIINGDSASDYAAFSPADSVRWRLGETGSIQLIITDWIADSDTDGMPDWWEMTHFSDRTGALKTDNADSDAHDNLTEYLADTDPQDSTSILMITNIVWTNSAATILWTGGREATQYVEIVSSLTATGLTWSSVHTNPPPTALSEAYQHAPASNNAVLFYRIRAKR